MRNLFINVKLGVFGTFVENNSRFLGPVQDLNLKALRYYKTETFRYYIENFIILNLPFIGKILFKIRHCILKILGKR